MEDSDSSSSDFSDFEEGQDDPGFCAAGGSATGGPHPRGISQAGVPSIARRRRRRRRRQPVPLTRRRGRCLHNFTLRIPFRYHLEAEVARRTLALYEENPAVRRQLTVHGSFLIAKWRAEDPQSLQDSFSSFLQHLSLLLRTMRNFGPLYPPVSVLGKGG